MRGSYRLHVSTKGQVTVGAGDLEGLNYALLTLMQMFAMFGDEGLVPVMIEDGPQCGVRAALWDMNPYGRVPKYVSGSRKNTLDDNVATPAICACSYSSRT